MSVEHRVVGPPGTGKTTYLSRQCLQASQKYGGDAIAIASLTRAAAREIASRSTGVPLENIGTLHAHAYRHLERPDLAETTEGVRSWNETVGNPGWQLSRRSVANPENAAPDEMGGSGDGGDDLLAEIGVYRARCVPELVWPQRLQAFWRAWVEWKSASGRLDFTDLIEIATEKVDTLGVEIMMLDEAQDMSTLEMRLARKWGESAAQIVVCGDPDQNLYEWRGSDPEAFYAAEASTTRVLAQSYRVPRAVHRLAVEWIERIPGRQPVDYNPRDDEGSVQRHQHVCYRDADTVARLLSELSQSGTVMYIASCGYMVTPVVAGLRAAALPFHNPYRTAQGQWNPLGRVDRLLAYLRPRTDAWGDQARMWTWEDVHKWANKLVAKGCIKRGSKSWIEGKARNVGRFDSENDKIIKSVVDVLNQFETEHWDAIVSNDIAWWHQHLEHQTQQSYRYAVDLSMRHGPWILREQPKIIIGTIHSVKGGEADHVVLAPDLSRAGIEDWMGNGQDAITRMFYVGMTRARKSLHILGPAGPDHVAL